MNDKMTFHSIAAAIATATGCTDEEAARFLRALLDKAGETLARGERVTINGVGTFAPGEPSQEPVIWAPDAVLADTVNEPFAAFEPVTLAAGITEEQLSQPISMPGEPEAIAPAEVETHAEVETPASVDTSTSVETPAEEAPATPVEAVHIPPIPPVPHVAETTTEVESAENEEETASVETSEAAVPKADAESAEVAPAVPEEPEAATEPEEHHPAVEPTEPEEYAYTEPEANDNSGINPWLMLIIGLLVGLAIGYFMGTSFGYLTGNGNVEADDEELVETADSIAEEAADTTPDVLVVEAETADSAAAAPAVAEQPKQEAAPAAAPAVVTDTVRARRYLTTMARKYYGDHCFWVYIYEENADRISNPDRIAPGTVVVIPPASKYGIDASNPESVRRAKAKIGELERRKK
jgi:hypothetical protein